MPHLPISKQAGVLANTEMHGVKKAQSISRALNQKTRQKMIAWIHKRESANVSQVYEAMEMEQSVASQHLAILGCAGIVMARRERKNRVYSLNYARIDQIQDSVTKLLYRVEEQSSDSAGATG